jgi:hypothetical protein
VLERLLQSFIGTHEWKETEILIWRGIDENIDIGLRIRFVAGIRTEQIERPHAGSPQGGLGLLQSGNDVISAHGANIAEKLTFSSKDSLKLLLEHQPAVGVFEPLQL